MSLFLLTVAKLEEVLFRGEVQSVSIPGEAGELTILAHHMPLVALLRAGIVRVKHKTGEESVQISGGMAEINSKEVTVLVH